MVVGKSTFLKTLVNINKPISGNIEIGNGLKYAYMSQNEIFEDNKNETIDQFFTKYFNKELERGVVYTILNNYGINYDKKDVIIQNLSPGEKVRLKLAEFEINNNNCLILDEVTNHLDIEGIEALEEGIKKFDGTILLVSHDRKLIDNINIEKELDINSGKIIDKEKELENSYINKEKYDFDIEL